MPALPSSVTLFTVLIVLRAVFSITLIHSIPAFSRLRNGFLTKLTKALPSKLRNFCKAVLSGIAYWASGLSRTKASCNSGDNCVKVFLARLGSGSRIKNVLRLVSVLSASQFAFSSAVKLPAVLTCTISGELLRVSRSILTGTKPVFCSGIITYSIYYKGTLLRRYHLIAKPFLRQ